MERPHYSLSESGPSCCTYLTVWNRHHNELFSSHVRLQRSFPRQSGRASSLLSADPPVVLASSDRGACVLSSRKIQLPSGSIGSSFDGCFPTRNATKWCAPRQARRRTAADTNAPLLRSSIPFVCPPFGGGEQTFGWKGRSFRHKEGRQLADCIRCVHGCKDAFAPVW